MVEITKDFIKIIATLIVVLSIFAVVFNSGILENLFALKTYAEPLTLLDHIASTIETASSCPGECSFSVRTSGLPYILQIYKDNGRYYASIDASLVEQKSNVKFLPNEQKPIFIKPLISDCVISEQKLAFTEGLIQDLTIEKVVEGTTCMISIQSKKVYYDFNITVNPDTLLVLNGTSSTTTATVSLIGGSIAPGSVTLTVMGVPPGITITLDKNNANPTFTSTMTVTAEPNAAPGTYNLTIMGTSGNLARTASLQIEVSPVLYTFILNSAISILKLPLTGVEVNLNSITKYTRQYDEFTSNIIYSMIPGTPYSIKAINPFADPKGPRPFSHFRDFDCQGNNTSYILDTNVNPYPFTIPNKYNIVYSRRMTAFYKDLTQIRNLEFDNVTNTISGSLLDEDFNSISKKETSYVACNVSTTVYPNRNVTIEYLDACSNSWKSIGSVASSFAQNRFYDNFDKDHNNWNINSGTWNITNGALNNSGIGYESIQTKWNFWNSSSNGNNNLEVSVNLSSGSNVSIRVFDAFDDYYLQTNDSYNNLYLWVNGALKASVTLTGIVPNQWNTWRIRQNNSYLEFYINNRKLIRFYNAPPIDFGRVQFRTFNTQAYFDNVTIYDGSWSYNFNIPCNVKKIKAAYTSSDWYYNDTYSVIDIDPTSIPCKLIVNTQIDIGKNQQSEPLPGIEVNVSDGVLNKKYTKNTSGPLATAVYFLASTFFPVHNITVNDTFNSRYFSHFYDQDCNPSNANYWLDNASNPYWFSMCRDKNITVQYKTFTDITSSSSSVSSLVPPTTIICDSTCKSQGFISGTCEAGSSTSTGTNLGVIPNDWGNGNPNPSSWIGYGSGNQIVFLDTTVERTPGNPSIWHRYTHIPACSNEAYDSSQSACLSNGGTWNPAGDMNGAREVDGIWYNVSVGDHVVFKCWEKTGLSQNPAYNNDPTDSYGVGARIGMDLYAPNPNRPGYIMIVAGALVNGLGDVNGNVISGHFASAGSDVPCNTSTWTQQVIDYIVPSGYGITQVVGWLQMRPETGDSVQGWFADCEMYINPSSGTCQSGETSRGQDGCSSGLCCCNSNTPLTETINTFNFDFPSRTISGYLLDEYGSPIINRNGTRHSTCTPQLTYDNITINRNVTLEYFKKDRWYYIGANDSLADGSWSYKWGCECNATKLRANYTPIGGNWWYMPTSVVIDIICPCKLTVITQIDVFDPQPYSKLQNVKVDVSGRINYTNALGIAQYSLFPGTYNLGVDNPFLDPTFKRGVWHFDEGYGNTVNDVSGNHNTGILNNMILPIPVDSWTESTSNWIFIAGSGSISLDNIDKKVGTSSVYSDLIATPNAPPPSCSGCAEIAYRTSGTWDLNKFSKIYVWVKYDVKGPYHDISLFDSNGLWRWWDITSSVLAGQWKRYEINLKSGYAENLGFNLASVKGISIKTKNLAGGTRQKTWVDDLSISNWVNGISGKALNFNGIDNYVNVPTSPSLDITNIATVEAWIKPTTVKTWARILGKGAWPDYAYLLLIGNSNDVWFAVNTSAQQYICGSGPNTISAGKWYHVLGVNNGTHVKLILDGVERCSIPFSGKINVVPGNLNIGRDANGDSTEYFNGIIDEVSVSSVSLRPFSHYWDSDCNNIGLDLDNASNPYTFSIKDRDRNITAQYKAFTNIKDTLGNLNTFEFNGTLIKGKLVDERGGFLIDRGNKHSSCGSPVSYVTINRNVILEYYNSNDGKWYPIGSPTVDSIDNVSWSYPWNWLPGAARLRASYIPLPENWYYNYTSAEIPLAKLTVFASLDLFGSPPIGNVQVTYNGNTKTTDALGKVEFILNSINNVIKVDDPFMDVLGPRPFSHFWDHDCNGFGNNSDSNANPFAFTAWNKDRNISAFYKTFTFIKDSTGSINAFDYDGLTISGKLQDELGNSIGLTTSKALVCGNSSVGGLMYRNVTLDYYKNGFWYPLTSVDTSIIDGSWSYNWKCECGTTKLRATYNHSDWYYNSTSIEKIVDPSICPCKLLVFTSLDMGVFPFNPPVPGVSVNVSGVVKPTNASGIAEFNLTQGLTYSINADDPFSGRPFSHFWDHDCDSTNASWNKDTESNPYTFTMHDRERDISAFYKIFTKINNLNYSNGVISGKLQNENNAGLYSGFNRNDICGSPITGTWNRDVTLEFFNSTDSTWKKIDTVKASTDPLDGSWSYSWICVNGATKIRANYASNDPKDWYYTSTSTEIPISCIGTLDVYAFAGGNPAIANVALRLGDVNWDGVIDSTDFNICNAIFGSYAGAPDWNLDCDVEISGTIDISDLSIIGNLANQGTVYENQTQFSVSVPAGTYKLRAKYDNQVRNNLNVVVNAGQTTRVDFNFLICDGFTALNCVVPTLTGPDERFLTGSCGRTSAKIDCNGVYNGHTVCTNVPFPSPPCVSAEPSISTYSVSSTSIILGNSFSINVNGNCPTSLPGACLVECMVQHPDGHIIYLDAWGSAAPTLMPSITCNQEGFYTVNYCGVYTDFEPNRGWKALNNTGTTVKCSTCSDPDGTDKTVKGTCTDQTGTYTDNCISGTTINEYVCAPMLGPDCTSMIDTTCPVGDICSNGACAPAYPLTFTAEVDENGRKLAGARINIDGNPYTTVGAGGTVTIQLTAGTHTINSILSVGSNSFSHIADFDCDGSGNTWDGNPSYTFTMYTKPRSMTAKYKSPTYITNTAGNPNTFEFDGATIQGKLVDESNNAIVAGSGTWHPSCSPGTSSRTINRDVSLEYYSGSSWISIPSAPSNGLWSQSWSCVSGATQLRATYTPIADNWYYTGTSATININCPAGSACLAAGAIGCTNTPACNQIGGTCNSYDCVAPSPCCCFV